MVTGWVSTFNACTRTGSICFDVVNLLVEKLVHSSCQKLVSVDTKSPVKREVCKDFMATGVAVVAKSLGLDKQ